MSHVPNAGGLRRDRGDGAVNLVTLSDRMLGHSTDIEPRGQERLGTFLLGPVPLPDVACVFLTPPSL
jgi:hypothetical protein